MAVTLSGKVSLNTAINLSNSLDVGSVTYPINFTSSTTFSNGTGDDQANRAFVDTRTLAASSSEELDLAGGLTDAFGNTLTFTKVKALIITAADANTNQVHVGGAASNGITSFCVAANDIMRVMPGGTLAMIAPQNAGYFVVAGTGDLLKIANSAGGTSVTYTIIIIGTV